MKRSLIILIACLFGATPLAQTTSETAGLSSEMQRIMSFNIRYNNPRDGEHAWPYRRDHVAALIQFHRADIVGMQEVLRGQVEDLQVLLPEFSWVGVGRDDGKQAGEYSPIFYRTEMYELLDHGTFWLSETPEIAGSKNWDAALTRIASWAVFKNKLTGRSQFHLNTHFDHRGEQARIESAAIILKKIDQLAEQLPVTVSGDFNVNPQTEAYAVMTGGLLDAHSVSQQTPYGPLGSFYGFTAEQGETGERIDYIFVSEGIVVAQFGILADQIEGNNPSDHLPVLAVIRLEQ